MSSKKICMVFLFVVMCIIVQKANVSLSLFYDNKSRVMRDSIKEISLLDSSKKLNDRMRRYTNGERAVWTIQEKIEVEGNVLLEHYQSELEKSGWILKDVDSTTNTITNETRFKTWYFQKKSLILQINIYEAESQYSIFLFSPL
jgi:hypothetical protein